MQSIGINKIGVRAGHLYFFVREKERKNTFKF